MSIPEVIVFSSKSPEAVNRLISNIRHLPFKVSLQQIDSIPRLATTLSQYRPVRPVVLLQVVGISELRKLLEISQLLLDLRIVLLLPDDHKQTYKAGLKLNPRYIASLYESPVLIMAIIELMLSVESTTSQINEQRLTGQQLSGQLCTVPDEPLKGGHNV